MALTLISARAAAGIITAAVRPVASCKHGLVAEPSSMHSTCTLGPSALLPRSPIVCSAATKLLAATLGHRLGLATFLINRTVK